MDTLLFGKKGKVSWGESNLINSSEVHRLVCKINDVAVKHELTKHIGVDVFYTRARVEAQVISLQYVPSELQLADFFTKAQTRAQHDFLLSKLSVVDPP
jgi:hypothetical protein